MKVSPTKSNESEAETSSSSKKLKKFDLSSVKQDSNETGSS